MYSNVDGLSALKGRELSILIQQEDPELIFIAETKLKEDYTI